MGGGDEISKLLIMAWSVFVTSPHSAVIQGPIQNFFIRKRNILIIQEITRGLRSSQSGTKVKEQIGKQNMLLVLLSVKEMKGFLKCVPGTTAAINKYIFNYLIKIQNDLKVINKNNKSLPINTCTKYKSLNSSIKKHKVPEWMKS